MTTADKPKRRVPRLWTILIAAAVLLLGLGALSIAVQRQREQAAIAEIDKIGGYVQGMKRGGPDWLRKKIGDERMKIFNRVTEVKLSFAPINEKFLVHLAALTSVESLYLDDTPFSDKA